MPNSLELVFQYFFVAGAGIGAGVMVTVLIPLAIYKKWGVIVWQKKK